MPLYTYQCTNSHVTNLFSKITERDSVRQCDHCGANLHRVFEAPAVVTEIQPYRSPVDGRWIDSRAARREDLKRNNSIEWEPGISQDMARRKQELAEKAFAPLDACIDKTARELVAAGKLDPL